MNEHIYKVITTEDSVKEESTPQQDKESLAKQMEHSTEEKTEKVTQTVAS